MNRKLDMEIEPNAPDWSNETPSDQLLAESLQEKLDKPFWRRGLSDWRERKRIKKLLEHLHSHGFKA
jgi:hypothetical protein